MPVRTIEIAYVATTVILGITWLFEAVAWLGPPVRPRCRSTSGPPWASSSWRP